MSASDLNRDAMPEWTFSLVLDGINVDDDDIYEAIYEATDSDVSPGLVDGVTIAEVTRRSPSFKKAVLSVIAELQEALPGLQVLEIEPEDMVSLDEIASRLGRTHESVRLLSQGGRGPGGFPTPAAQIGRSGLWHWSEVSSWLESHAYEIKHAHHVEPDVVKSLNAALALRSQLSSLPASDREELLNLAKAV